MKTRRFTREDIINEKFFKLSKFLFDDYFRELNSDARILYSLLKDRHSLSEMNNWFDDNNCVYLIYTRENMAEMIGCSVPTVRKAFNLLRKYKLVDEVRQGLNKPNLIYLLAVTVDNTRTEKTFHSREENSFNQERKILSPNKTEVIKTDKSKTEYIHLPEEDDFIFFYLKTFKEYKGKDHMKVKAIDCYKINEAISELGSNDISLGEWEEVVEEHFANLPKSNNGNILAFIKATKRYFDVGVE